MVRLLRDIEGGPSDPEGFERGRALPRALAPANAVDLAIRYEAHLTRQVGRLLTQLEQARRLSALVDGELLDQGPQSLLAVKRRTKLIGRFPGETQLPHPRLGGARPACLSVYV